VKERARRLREKGDTALKRHLVGEVGKLRRVLMESADTGRTEQFTPVRVAAVAQGGAIIDVTIAGCDGRQLFAKASFPSTESMV
jgi:threonylcarbamoyladenosine tRNA methylthiotransferase MtaB